MKKILCLLVIAALAAQICARPDDKADAAKKAADAAKDAEKKAADTAKDADKKAPDAAKDAEKKAEAEAKDMDKKAEDVVDKGAEDCEKPAEEVAKKIPKPHHKGGFMAKAIRQVKKFDDAVLDFWADISPF